MELREFEALQKKIETLKEKQSKAMGAKESIEAGWRDTYGVSTLNEIEALLAEKEKEMEETEALIDELWRELKGLTSWNLV